MKKLLVLLPWAEFLDVHLVKDVGLFPEYLSAEYKIAVDFVFLDNKKTGTKKNEYKGMKLIKLNPLDNTGTVPRLLNHPFKFFSFLKIFTDFLKKNEHIYSHIMMFHINSTTLFFARFIKKLDKNIKIYIKADVASFTKKQWAHFEKIISIVDSLSIESEALAKDAKERFPRFAKKIGYIPNGFDDKNFDKSLLNLPKENLIIQTARFGTAPKNTQLLLDILSSIDLKDWKVILAGPIESSFIPFIENFFENHSALKDKILFIGNISERNKIYELYAKAKIFMLTSRWESFSLSLIEAAYFGDYIISTDVGIAKKLSGFIANGSPKNVKNDESIKHQIAHELQRCINAGIDISDRQKQKKIQETFSMRRIVKSDFYKDFFYEKQVKQKSVCFVLPGYSRLAIGGYKIAYEYANRLAEKGYSVCIFYPQFSKNYPVSLFKIICKIYSSAHYFISRLTEKRWFSLKNVKEILRFSYNKEILSKYDVLVATSIDTAFNLHDLALDKSKSCIYLIQDFEKWPPFLETHVFESYKFPMKKICIAPWLLEKVQSVGEKASLISNGLDFSYFKLTKKIEERNPLEISLMYHERPTKRFKDAEAALKIVHEKFPKLHVSVFGVFNNPGNFPDYFTYYKSPSKDIHNSIYNNSAIYVAASSDEGFGLTVAEALMCGCAVACTNNGGFSLMVNNEEGGLLSPAYDYNALAENIMRLILDNSLRIRLAKKGYENIKKFNWETAVKKFTNVIEGSE